MHIRGDLTLGWVIAATVMIAITVTTISANLVMLQAVRKAQRAPAHYAMTSLLMADLLVGLCVLPIAALSELVVFNPPWALCACWSTLDVMCCTASILSLCTLCWERWSGITAPLALPHRSRYVKMLVNLLWLASAIIALPTAFIPSLRHYFDDEVPKACTANTNIGYVFASVTFSFYLPSSVMLFFYAMIIRALAISPDIRAHRGRSPKLCDKKVKNNENKNAATKNELKCSKTSDLKISETNVTLTPNNCKLKVPTALIPSPLRKSSPGPLKYTNTLSSIIPRQRRATQTIVMLMSLFLFCWAPFFVMLPLDSLCNCVHDATWQWCTWLGYANSALNPLVYAAASPSVRKALPSSLPLSTAQNAPSPNVRRTN